MIFIDFQWFSISFIDFLWSSLLFNWLHGFSSCLCDFHLLSFSFIGFNRFSLIFMCFQWLLIGHFETFYINNISRTIASFNLIRILLHLMFRSLQWKKVCRYSKAKPPCEMEARKLPYNLFTLSAFIRSSREWWFKLRTTVVYHYIGFHWFYVWPVLYELQ